MANGDSQLAQAIYLANLFAARGTCQCEACQLLRKSTEGMTQAFLGGAGGGPGGNIGQVMQQMSKVPGAQPGETVEVET